MEGSDQFGLSQIVIWFCLSLKQTMGTGVNAAHCLREQSRWQVCFHVISHSPVHSQS